MGDGEADLRSDLIDLTEVDLARLAELPSSALAVSLRRILQDDGTSPDQYASFQNTI
ncbi:FxSxx-COOH cyclophane-containing RiPP peptide [Saccharopolyspora rosea]|uniref:FxSxx-COOH cyclophane-containing RiPP peptide n=1 Tax=Saccharopolyspora rosea TaxID=524884 RepID=A0ABW3FY17_9PSEU|nr:FxSxx-COOH cyclophane-containing RiPP peptide [Saccharopolyspora rosea]